MADLRNCPLCNRNVKWVGGSIMCLCGLEYRHFTGDFDITNQTWNNRPDIKEEKFTSDNKAIVQLLSDCQDVICHSVFLDDKQHLALMQRINAVVEQQHQ